MGLETWYVLLADCEHKLVSHSKFKYIFNAASTLYCTTPLARCASSSSRRDQRRCERPGRHRREGIASALPT
eukprot:6135053-Pleurochrysis_carterae.AAC.1